MRDFLKINLLLFLILLIVSSCKDKAKTYQQLSGETWGTYYRLTYAGDDPQQVHDEVKEILTEFDQVLSTYVSDSHISVFNTADKNSLTLSKKEDRYFEPVYDKSKQLSASTDGYLNVAVMPLLNYWGFGYKAERRHVSDVDSSKVSRLRTLCNIENIQKVKRADSTTYIKKQPNAEIDFSALAKGYGIDIIAQHLEAKGILDYLIDIGGEFRAKGVNKSGKPWSLAINKPHPDASYTTQELIISLHDKSIATSGNYREMYVSEGKVLGHIVNPITGYPYPSDVLSATIIADDCMTADGLATACVAAGLEKAKEIVANHPGIAACFIYDADGDTNLEKHYTGGFKKYVLVEN